MMKMIIAGPPSIAPPAGRGRPPPPHHAPGRVVGGPNEVLIGVFVNGAFLRLTVEREEIGCPLTSVIQRTFALRCSSLGHVTGLRTRRRMPRRVHARAHTNTQHTYTLISVCLFMNPCTYQHAPTFSVSLQPFSNILPFASLAAVHVYLPFFLSPQLSLFLLHLSVLLFSQKSNFGL